MLVYHKYCGKKHRLICQPLPPFTVVKCKGKIVVVKLK
jgi:hypothetical protein